MDIEMSNLYFGKQKKFEKQWNPEKKTKDYVQLF